jgi:tetraacyldisaccharide 4'-kinase
VGNLNLGGTGKTPHTEYLIELLKNDFRLATLSSGYGRKTKGFRLADALCTYEDLGDEPLQYFTKYPDIQVAVDKNRIEGVTNLLGKQKVEVILLDDAFQYRSINAGLNILLTDYQHLYPDDFLFPAGTLRDIKSAAKRADIIVVSKSPKTLDKEKKQQVINKLKPSVEQKVFFSYLEYDDLKPLNANAKQFDTNAADSALLFCGIAHPNPLIDKLKEQYKQLEVMTFADHHPYTENDVKTILKRFENVNGEKKIIITTEKDAARLTNSPYLCQFESTYLYALPVVVRFHEEEKFNNEILSYVRKNPHHSWLY